MRYYSNLAAEMQLTASVNSSETVLALSGVAGLPATFPFTLVVDVGTASEEVVTCTGLTGLSATVTRGADGTSATAHGSGSKVRHMLTARDLSEPQVHIAAANGVHGVNGSVVGTTDAQTLTNKTVDGSKNTLSNVPKSALPTDTVYTTNSQVLTGKSLDGATNTFTNLPKAALPNTVVYTTDTQTLTGKTMSGASNTFSAIPDGAITGLSASKLSGTVAKANLPADTVYTAALPVIDSGEMAYTFAGGSLLAHTISFTAGKFSTAPHVVAIIRTGYRNLVVYITSAATTASVELTVASVDGTAITGTVYVNWVAVQ